MSTITGPIYDTATGEILRTFSGPVVAVDLQLAPGEAFTSGEASDVRDYVDPATGAILPKGDYIIDALPLPCTVTIEGVEYSCTEQPTFAFNYPGTYTVSVDAGPRYLKKEFEVVWP